MVQAKAHSGSCRTARLIMLPSLACTGGCLFTGHGVDQLDELNSFRFSSASESGVDLTSIPAAPPRTGPDFMRTFRDRLEGRYVERLHSPIVSPLCDNLASANLRGSSVEPGLVPPGGIDDEDRRALMEDAGTECRRLVRRAFRDALSQEPAYQELRDLFRIRWSDSSIARFEAGPFAGDPAWDDGFMATRALRGISESLFRPLEYDDMDGNFSIGLRPRMGVSWMRLYKFTWEPHRQVMIHRLEYQVGPVGVGLAYQFEAWKAMQVGLGMFLPLGATAATTLTASRNLYGSDAAGEQQLLLGVAWKF